MIELNRIYNEDCLATLSRMDDESVDLIVTSPPYNKNFYASASGDTKSWSNLRGRQIAYDSYNDDMHPDDYADWQKRIISECLRVLKPTGSMFYNHKDILANGEIVSPKFVYDYPVHQQIVWNRGSSLANDPHYFQPITEYIYWLVKDAKSFYFDKSKAICKQSVWNINFETNTKHPAPFPVKLVNNCVSTCCPVGGGSLRPLYGKWHYSNQLYKGRGGAEIHRLGDFRELREDGYGQNMERDTAANAILT